ncbi:MAG: asparagine synthase C-terminal domain-containing protein [Nitrospira sp. BO4]|jgi:asparagine synthase (glutamine-hydrolysing)|nr:asparagine synthase C-terminal domain-containing protein [Nitrospira sp. BO4]
MLLVRVQSRSAAAGPASKSDDESARDFDCGDLRVGIRTGSLFGFQCKIGDWIVAGESCFPLKGDDIRPIEEGILNGVPLQLLLGDSILVLVVIDASKRVVTIAHSIASARPCYLSVRPGFIIFSTSVRGLKEAGHEVAWDPACTPEYLLYRSIAPSRSILRGVRRLAGGQLVVVDLVEGRIREDRPWRWPERGDVDPRTDIIDQLRPHIEEWLQRFPNAGILLSGGLDSSLLTALARIVRPDVPTFSTSFSFANSGDGEAQYALSMARHLGVAHEVHKTTSERYLTGWVESIHAAEEPVHHLQSVLLHILFQDRAASGHGSILSGEGADCVIGNSSHEFLYRHRAAVALLRATNLGSAWASLTDALGWNGPRTSLLTRRYDGRLSSPHHFLWLLGRYGDRAIVQRLLSCDETAFLGERPWLLEAYHDRSLLDQVTALALLSDVHATIAIWGKLAEASGVYLTCPFTIPSVLTAVMTVPWDVKLREKKHLVRAALRQLGIPETFLTRPKLSFGFPTRFWAPKGALFQPIVDMAVREHDPRVLESLQRDEGGAPMVLWCLLNQFLWMQLFEVGRSVGDLSGEVLDRRRAAAKAR